jgi:hypothetical protein
MNNQRITLKIIAPDTHQLLRSLRAIESLNPTYIEGQILKNDNDTGMHCFLTFPLNWFLPVEAALTEKDNIRYGEQPSQEPLHIATANPVELNGVEY